MPGVYKRGERPSWHIFNSLRGIDLFGQPVPSFNVKGEDSINTVVGGVLSGMVMLITLAFAGHKVVQLIEKTNPVMSELEQRDHYGPLDKLFYNEINFKMAFSVEGFWDK